MSDAIESFGTMCPVRTVGNPGVFVSQLCVYDTFVLSGKLMVSGLITTHLLSTVIFSIVNMAGAPVLAIACVVVIVFEFRFFKE